MLWLLYLLVHCSPAQSEADPPAVRLVNGPSSCSGRVEVYYNGTWGTVCDDQWDLPDAQVVCRQLGCGRALSAKTSLFYGQGYGNIWLDDVECSGSESSLSQCTHRGVGINNCNHHEDAGVTCEVGYPVRLVDGPHYCSGRVEVSYDGRWGTVCYNDRSMHNAGVVCEELGCGKALSAAKDDGNSSLSVPSDDIRCSYNGRDAEINLLQCKHSGFGNDTCAQSGVVAVVCEGDHPVRLVNGTNSCSGRVEVSYNGTWGTVCGDGWDLADAQVVCRQLGCGSALSANGSAVSGQGVGNILLDEVRCSGNETGLAHCKHRGFGNKTHTCRHPEAAGVTCEAVHPVRLVKRQTPCQGKVEILYNGTWGAVCTGGWDLPDAQVVCRQLGCGRALTAGSSHWDYGVYNVWLDAVKCSGSESSLSQCSHPGFGTVSCGDQEHEHEYADVTCQVGHPVRLADGPNSCAGRVEINSHGRWETVCGQEWDLTEAQVVCRELGCGRPLSVKRNAFYGRGDGNYSAEISCSGTEPNLFQCSHGEFGTSNCDDHSDVGVACEGVLPVTLLNGPPNSCSGRVEVLDVYGDTSGPVCGDGWDLSEAHVVCRQLGCGRALSAVKGAFGQGVENLRLDALRCSGNESSLAQCSHSGFGNGCRNREDAGVTCEDDHPVRLVNSDGHTSCSGRVEILYNGTWGSVCNDEWDLPDAQVVCRQLGCGRALSAGASGYHFYRERYGNVWLEAVKCSGNESGLSQCSHPGFGTNNCSHDQVAGVTCEVDYPVRLVDGPHSCAGRVEVHVNGRWGTVCGDKWNLTEAQVVCRELGCGQALSATRNSSYGQVTDGNVLLNEVGCSGDEATLLHCSYEEFGSDNCGHSDVAGVVCQDPDHQVPDPPPPPPPPPPPQSSKGVALPLVLTAVCVSLIVLGVFLWRKLRDPSCVRPGTGSWFPGTSVSTGASVDLQYSRMHNDL